MTDTIHNDLKYSEQPRPLIGINGFKLGINSVDLFCVFEYFLQ